MSYCKNTKDGTTPHSTNNDYFSLSVSYDDNVLKEEFENLRKIKVSICDLENPDRFYKIPFFMLGRACSNNFFHRIRLSVPTQNKKETPLEWTEKHKKSYNEIQRIKHPATQFPPIVATHVCSVLMGLSKKKQFVVFDPYAGWGDRLLGISAVDGAKYIGVDLNPKLQIQANKLINFYNINNQHHSYETGRGEDVIKRLQLNGDEFDCVFTSPPFYYIEEQVSHKLNLNKNNDKFNGPHRLTEAYPETTPDYGEFMKTSLFQVFKVAYNLKKDVLLYISPKMQQDLLPIVGKNDEVFSFTTSRGHENSNNIYWWRYSLDTISHSPPCEISLELFLQKLGKYKPIISRSPTWPVDAIDEFMKLRYQEKNSCLDISKNSIIIRDWFDSKGINENDYLKIIQHKNSYIRKKMKREDNDEIDEIGVPVDDDNDIVVRKKKKVVEMNVSEEEEIEY